MKLKRLLSFALVIVIAVTVVNVATVTGVPKASAEATSEGDKLVQNGLLFTLLEDGTFEVGYNYNGKKPTGTVTVPERVNGKAVTRIAEAGFANCGELANIVVPNSVTSVGANAFLGTKFLDDQTGTIKYAGKVAVYCDPEADTAEIKEGTLGLADRLFYRCPGLKTAALPESLQNLGFMTFSDCEKLTKVNIPSGIKTIGSGVFSNCTELSSVRLPNGITGIGAYAFYNTAITAITIPESVTEIGKGAFEGSSLKADGVTVGYGRINIGGRAFFGTPFYEEQDDMKYAGSVFLGCGSGVADLKLLDGTTAIADMALSGNKTIRSVTIPSGVITIGSDAFFDCSGLTSVTIPEGVKGIGEDAFRLCKGLTSVSLPLSISSIGQGAFYGCPKLKTVNYPGSVIDWSTNIEMGIENDSLLSVQPTLGKYPKYPDPITELKVTDTGLSSVSLSWSKSPLADNYRIDAFIGGKWKTVGKSNKTYGTANGLEAYSDCRLRVYALARNVCSTPVEITARTRVATVSDINVSASNDSVTLSWKEIPNVDYYTIDICKGGEWERAAQTQNGKDAFCTVNDLDEKTAYQFRIWAYREGEHGPPAAVEATTTALDVPAAVTGLKATNTTSSSITLTWNKTPTADEYEIDVRKDGKWTYVARITDDSYTVSGLSADTSYDFRVFSFKGIRYSSSAKLTARTSSAPFGGEPQTVSGLRTLNITSDSVTLIWDKNAAADEYEIDVRKDGKWTYVAKITDNFFTISGLSANTEHDFKVFSFKGSEFSPSARLTVKTSSQASDEPKTVTGFRASNVTSSSIVLSWDKTPTADEYEIDVRKDGKWTYVAKTTGDLYTVKELSANTEYDFKVFSLSGSKHSPSARLTVKTSSGASGAPETVTGLKTYNTTSSTINLTWNKTPTADEYEIDMYKDGKWIYVAKITGNSYTISGLSANTEYDFKVFSFKGNKYSRSARLSAKTDDRLPSLLTDRVINTYNAPAAVRSSAWKMMKGIDVSGWQGEIDFNAVKSDGIDFVIVKAGDGNLIVDTWEKNFKNAKEAGLMVGAYWYCTSTTLDGAKAEAQLFVEALEGKRLDFPVYLDMEESKQFDKGKVFCTQLAETFCSELEDAGYYAGVYCSKAPYTKYVDDDCRAKRPNWIAQHLGESIDKCYYDGSYGIWQFGLSKVDGVKDNCDCNWGYFDYSGYIKAHSLNGFSSP